MQKLPNILSFQKKRELFMKQLKENNRGTGEENEGEDEYEEEIYENEMNLIVSREEIFMDTFNEFS